MGSNDATAPNVLDRLLKYAGPLLGVATAALSFYIAFMTRETNEQIPLIKVETDKLKLQSERYDLAPRLVAELGAQNAGEFSATLRQQAIPVRVPDPVLDQQLAEGARAWAGKNHLMTGEATTGLYLRQIVYLRLSNLGRTAASELRLVVRQKDFSLVGNGTQLKRYGELDTRAAGWTERELPLPDLMEPAAAAQGMATRVLIPLAQVSGGEYYFGRVLVPVKLVWTDKRQKLVDELPVQLGQAGMLDNQLNSAILGMSVSSRDKCAACTGKP